MSRTSASKPCPEICPPREGSLLVQLLGRIVQTRPGEDGKGPTTTDMRMDFSDFGLEPEIEVPDSGEVFDATSVTREKLEASHGE